MIDALLVLPPHLRERLACALETGLLQGMPPASALVSVLGPVETPELVAGALADFQRLSVGAPAAAAWLRSLNTVQGSAPRTDLVWSGPGVSGVHARDTARVYDELLGSAVRSLWVSTYVFFDGPRAFEVLARRMDGMPDLQVTVLLNLQRQRGDTTAAEHLVRRFADRFWGVEWPGSTRPRIFYDPRALDAERPGGVLHAKAVVADDDTVFVTSANLTEAAFERNIELGLLVRDRALAGSIVAHFRGLIDRDLLHVLPAR